MVFTEASQFAMSAIDVQSAALNRVADPIDRKLRRAWSLGRFRAHLLGVGRLVIGILVMLMFDALVDWLFLLPALGRMILLGVNAVVLGGLIWRWWWRELERYDPLRVALRVERQHPQLADLLVTYVQCDPAQVEPTQISVALAHAMRRQAAVAVGALNFNAIVRLDDLRRPAAIMLVLWLVCGAMIWQYTDHFRVLLMRLTNPMLQIEYPTRTQILRVSGDMVLPPGGAAKLAAEVGRLVPESGELRIRKADAGWRSLRVRRGEAGWFVSELHDVREPFEYRWFIGDGRSGVYRVSIAQPPRVQQVEVEQVWPKSEGGQTLTTDQLSMRVPPGTKIIWRITLDRPVQAAAMWKLNPPGAKQKRSPLCRVSVVNERVLQATWKARQSVAYGLAFKDVEHGFMFDDALTYRIDVAEDAPPQIEMIEEPEPTQIATANKQVDLHYRVSDDRGVVAANVVFTVNGGPAQRHRLATYERDRYLEDKQTWKLRDSLPKLSEGDRVQYSLEIVDRTGKGAERLAARTTPAQIEIVSVAAYQRKLLEELRAVKADLESARRRESQAASDLESLIEDSEEP